MSYYLFLDDTRIPHKVSWANLPENVSWVIARSYDEFVATIDRMGVPQFVTYDCDLCDEHYEAYFKLRHDYVKHYKTFKTRCGIECAEYLINLCKKNDVRHPPFKAHTRNEYAQRLIEDIIHAHNMGIPEKLSPMRSASIPDYALHNDIVISGFFGDYRFLSNFWPAEVTWKGLKFGSVEAAYQAAKCANPDEMKKFIGLSPSESKMYGKRVILRPDWDTARLDVMKNLVKDKFLNHAELGRLLDETGTRTLIEANNWRDKFWGVAYKFNHDTKLWECLSGQNHLGQILMGVRDMLL